MRLFRVDFKDKIRPPILIRGKTKAQVALDMKEKYGEYIVRVDYISHEDAESQFGHFDLFKEGINVKTADMGDVVDDFYKSDAPQFKGKSKTKRRQMAIAAKLSADEDKKVPSMASLENKPKLKIQLKKATNAYDKNKDVLAKHGFKRPSMNENDKYDNEYNEEIKMIKDQFKNHIDEISKDKIYNYLDKSGQEPGHKKDMESASSKRDKGFDMATKKVIGKAKVNATESNIDEISKDMKSRYIKKAVSNLKDRSFSQGMAYSKPFGGSSPEAQRNDIKIDNRMQGIKKAAKEDINQVDEISKNTAASYISKASRDVYHKGTNQGRADAIAGAGGSHPDQNYDTGPERKAAKRVGGIDKATKRLMKKETFAPPYAEFITPESDLNEEMYFKVNISGLPDMYMTASSAGMIKAKLRKMLKNMDMIGDIVKTPKADVRKAFRMKAMEGEESTNEEAIVEKQRLDPNCWDGYKKAGTKMKGGIRVNNCVPEGKAYGPTGVSYFVPKGHKDEVDPKTKEKYPERQKEDTVKEVTARSSGYGIRNKVSDMPGVDYSWRDKNKGSIASKDAVKRANAQSDAKRAEYRKKMGMKEDIIDNVSKFGPPKEAEVQESKKKVDVIQQVNFTSILTGDNPFYRSLPEDHGTYSDNTYADGDHKLNSHHLDSAHAMHKKSNHAGVKFHTAMGDDEPHAVTVNKGSPALKDKKFMGHVKKLTKMNEGHDEIQDKNADGLDDNQKPEGSKTAKQFPAPKDAKKKMKNMKMEFFKQDEVSDYMIEKSKLKKGDMKMRGGKLEPKAMAALKTMSQDEAKVLVQGLPANLRRSTMKELGIKEVVDGRTTAFKTTVERLITAKNKPELDEADMTDAQVQSAKKDDSAMVKSAQKKARADVINSMNKPKVNELKTDDELPNLKGLKEISDHERKKAYNSAKDL